MILRYRRLNICFLSSNNTVKLFQHLKVSYLTVTTIKRSQKEQKYNNNRDVINWFADLSFRLKIFHKKQKTTYYTKAYSIAKWQYD